MSSIPGPTDRLPALAIFDIAGTTVRDDGQVPAAFLAALAGQGITASAAEIALVRGSSKKEAIRQFIPDGPERAFRTDRAYASFQEHLIRSYEDEGVAAIPGAEETFAWLRERGVRIALNTGFDRVITRLLLSALHWSEPVVGAVVCGDDVLRGRPAPDLLLRAMEMAGVSDPRRVASVGDTTLDLLAGSRAGVAWNIGVFSGAHDRERLMAAPHTHLFPSVREVPSLWEPLEM